MELDDLLREMVTRSASDLHLKAGRPPLMRIAGELLPTEYPPLEADELQRLVYRTMSEMLASRFEEERDVDYSYDLEGVARFRVNALHQKGFVGAVLRLIPIEVPTVDALGLPKVLKEMATKRQGMILVTGPTGSGKSTTLAAVIEHINQNEYRHIVTIEDPIEFIYTDKKATINQRELGNDTLSLDEALRRVLRQDPDVILMGEMRDQKTMEFGMHAAETGHLVLSTLHTIDAKQTLDRMLDAFPAVQATQIRLILSATLVGVVSQRLVKRADKKGRVAAIEVLVNAPHVQQLLAEGRTTELDKAMGQAGRYYGMQTFNQALARLLSGGVISEEEALATSTNPDNLKLVLRGIATGGEGVGQAGPGAEGKPEVSRPAARTKPASGPGLTMKRR